MAWGYGLRPFLSGDNVKRRASILKRRAEKKAAKARGMQNPSGESRYAQKKRGTAPPRKGKSRPSWFERYNVGITPAREVQWHGRSLNYRSI